MATYIIVAILAYAIGSVNFSVLISRKMAGFDVREKGSGNAGTTNVLRAVGVKAAIITLICDILKGIIAVLLAFWIGNMSQTVDKALLIQILFLIDLLGIFRMKNGIIFYHLQIPQMLVVLLLPESYNKF